MRSVKPPISQAPASGVGAGGGGGGMLDFSISGSNTAFPTSTVSGSNPQQRGKRVRAADTKIAESTATNVNMTMHMNTDSEQVPPGLQIPLLSMQADATGGASMNIGIGVASQRNSSRRDSNSNSKSTAAAAVASTPTPMHMMTDDSDGDDHEMQQGQGQPKGVGNHRQMQQQMVSPRAQVRAADRDRDRDPVHFKAVVNAGMLKSRIGETLSSTLAHASREQKLLQQQFGKDSSKLEAPIPIPFTKAHSLPIPTGIGTSGTTSGISMTNKIADLDGFPIMRLDQISLVESPLLEQAIREVPDLLHEMRIDAAKNNQAVPKMAFYLQKQVDNMRTELAKRAAQERVFNILQGSSEVFSDYETLLGIPLRFSTDYSTNANPNSNSNSNRRSNGQTVARDISSVEQQQDRTAVSHVMVDAITQNRDSRPVTDGQVQVVAGIFKPIPLPSQLNINNSTISGNGHTSNDHAKNGSLPHRSLSASAARIPPIASASTSIANTTNNNSSGNRNYDPVSYLSGNEPSTPSIVDAITRGSGAGGASEVGNEYSIDQSPYQGTARSSGVTTVTGDSSGKSKRNIDKTEREKRAQIEAAAGYDDHARATLGLSKPVAVARVNTNNDPNANGNSWGGGERNERALQVVYRTFGSEFVVAATEKKKRFEVKKKVKEESMEEKINRERLNRRKEAMQRLMDRREAQQKSHLARQQKKMKETKTSFGVGGGGAGEKQPLLELRGVKDPRKSYTGTSQSQSYSQQHTQNKRQIELKSSGATGSGGKQSSGADEVGGGRNINKFNGDGDNEEEEAEEEEEEESVSGGDEDENVQPVSTDLVERVTEAICERIAEESRGNVNKHPPYSPRKPNIPFNALKHGESPDDKFEEMEEELKRKRLASARKTVKTSPRARDVQLEQPTTLPTLYRSPTSLRSPLKSYTDTAITSTVTVAQAALSSALSKTNRLDLDAEEADLIGAVGGASRHPVSINPTALQSAMHTATAKSKKPLSPIQRLQIKKAQVINSGDTYGSGNSRVQVRGAHVMNTSTSQEQQEKQEMTDLSMLENKARRTRIPKPSTTIAATGTSNANANSDASTTKGVGRGRGRAVQMLATEKISNKSANLSDFGTVQPNGVASAIATVVQAPLLDDLPMSTAERILRENSIGSQSFGAKSYVDGLISEAKHSPRVNSLLSEKSDIVDTTAAVADGGDDDAVGAVDNITSEIESKQEQEQEQEIYRKINLNAAAEVGLITIVSKSSMSPSKLILNEDTQEKSMTALETVREMRRQKALAVKEAACVKKLGVEADTMTVTASEVLKGGPVNIGTKTETETETDIPVNSISVSALSNSQLPRKDLVTADVESAAMDFLIGDHSISASPLKLLSNTDANVDDALTYMVDESTAAAAVPVLSARDKAKARKEAAALKKKQEVAQGGQGIEADTIPVEAPAHMSASASSGDVQAGGASIVPVIPLLALSSIAENANTLSRNSKSGGVDVGNNDGSGSGSGLGVLKSPLSPISAPTPTPTSVAASDVALPIPFANSSHISPRGEGTQGMGPRTPTVVREPNISPRSRKPIKSKTKAELASTKLTLQAPLIEQKDGVYFCSLGPDELPGLLVWTLENVNDDGSVDWGFNMSHYFEPVLATEQLKTLREQRNLLRRTVSRGLIILAQDCQNLLRGTVFAQNENHFKKAWDSALRKFDDQVELMGSKAHHMFDQVAVDGNCHALCRKLENLIKTYFVQMGNQLNDESSEDAKTGAGIVLESSPPLGASSMDQSQMQSMDENALVGMNMKNQEQRQEGESERVEIDPYVAYLEQQAAADGGEDNEEGGIENDNVANEKPTFLFSQNTLAPNPTQFWERDRETETETETETDRNKSNPLTQLAPFPSDDAASFIYDDDAESYISHHTQHSNHINSARESHLLAKQFQSRAHEKAKQFEEGRGVAKEDEGTYHEQRKITKEKEEQPEKKKGIEYAEMDEKDPTVVMEGLADMVGDALSRLEAAERANISHDDEYFSDSIARDRTYNSDKKQQEKGGNSRNTNRDRDSSAHVDGEGLLTSADSFIGGNGIYAGSDNDNDNEDEDSMLMPTYGGSASSSVEVRKRSPREKPLIANVGNGDGHLHPHQIAMLALEEEPGGPLSPREHKELRQVMDRLAAVIEASPITTLLHPPKPIHKLSDLYSHIGMIFPIAYSQLGHGKTSDSIDARALVESMQQQAKLYDEWLEVMEDYATVFSHDERFTIGLEKGELRGRHGLQERVRNDETNGSIIPHHSNNATTTRDDGNNASSSVYNGGTKALHYRVKSSRPEVYDIVTDVFRDTFNKTWEELPSGLGLGVSWNLLWTWSKPRINMSHLLVWQRVNHFHDSKQLTRKDLLKKNLQRFTDMNGKSAEAFEIMPQTFILPQEYTQLVKAFTLEENKRNDNDSQNFWIMKPVGMSRGRGISLVRDIGSLTYSTSSVVQRYVERPLCLDGYKFDLRLFVLVTSFKPLEAFIYREGFARMSMQRYSLHPGDMANKFIHLTNASIQKEAEDIDDSNPVQDTEETQGGSKIPLHGPYGLWKRLEESGMDIELIWRNICVCVLKSLIVVDERMSHQPCCFEVFGYDVLLDDQLKPWLIEVNASPSMSRQNKLDVRVKNAMIRDTIKVVDAPPYDRAAVSKVIKRRLGDISKNRFSMNKNDPKLEEDLRDILGDQVPRQIGEDPKNMGDYQKLCPNTKIHQHVLRLKGKIINPLAR